MTVKCRLCGEQIVLNKDTIEARAAKTDPCQQMKRHNRSHVFEIMKLVSNSGIGYFMDAMFFESVDSPDKFRAIQQMLFDWVRSKEALIKDAEPTNLQKL